MQAGPYVAVHELRLMLIGDGEVGKTSLVKALKDGRAVRIPKEDRTVGVDLSELVFPADGGPELRLQVCDFAGQEIYYLSHTLQFTRRSLYVLMWTAHKFSESGAAQALAVDDIVAPLKRWLQLLSANVPEASVVVVGTHCRVDPGAFESVQLLVDAHVKEEMKRLRFIAEEEAKATRRVVELQEEKVQKLCGELEAESSALGSLAAPNRRNLSLQACEQFSKDVAALRPPPSRSLRRKAQVLLQAMQELMKTTLRLGRLHGVHDGSSPAASAAVARLKLVNERSYAVDSVDGVGVAGLLRDIEATCRDRDALPFMGEQVPVSWLQVKDALKVEAVRTAVGDCVISVRNAAAKICNALLQSQLEVDVGRARALRDADVRRCLEFWSLLGQVFVYNGHFLRDVTFVIELMKPLVHHKVTGRQFLEEFCSVSFDGMGACLLKLQHDAVLDRRLLPCFKSWASSSPEARESILKFFKESFMISDLVHVSAPGGSSCLVTARLCDSSDAGQDRQRRVAAQAAAIEADAEFHAVYAIPSSHIGLIAHMQAVVQRIQPSGMHLHVACSHSHVCISLESGSRMKCSVSLRSLDEVFRSEKLGSLKEKMSDDIFSQALVICSSDDGLFAFAARCVDAIMHSGAFSAHFECWLPVAPFHAQACARADWAPAGADWTMVGGGENTMRLSQIVCANSDAQVMSVPRRKLREVVPRRPPVFMSHTFIRGGSNSSGDGTGEFCQRLKDRLQERLMCTVWFDRDEMGWTSAFAHLMKVGVAQASAFVVCLSPLYLTRPNCLRELMWAMDICEKDRSKVLRIIPTHASVSFAGCKRIIDVADSGRGAHVILPADDTDLKSPPLRVGQLKGHSLSEVAISLLRRLTGPQNLGTNAEWLKLQPWLSDVEGENWEETSQGWNGPSEGKSVEMESCFDALALDLQAAVLGDRRPSPLDWLVDVEDDRLQSAPRSQEYLEAPDTALLRSCFPLTLSVFPEEEDAVKLMVLGLQDRDIISCVQHGLTRISSVTSQANPVDAVFRMAAHMSAVNFDAAAQRLQQQQGTVSSSSPSATLKRTNEAKPNKAKEGVGSEPNDPLAPAPVVSTENETPLPISPPPPPTLSDSTPSTPALALTPPPPAAARHERTLSRALVQRCGPQWQPDDSRDNCGVCRKEFRWSLRRHHCR
jgi:GTPase SAR1 family protein